MESLGKSKVKRKRKKRELDEEENSVDIKRIKTEFDEEALEAYHEEHKGKKHKNKKKNKKHKVKKNSENTDNQQVVEKSEQNDIDADNEDSGCGQPPSRHLKTRERFLDSLKTDVSRLEVSSEGEEDQYEDLHRESCRQQLKNSSRKHGRWNVQEMENLKKNLQQFKKINRIQDLENWIKMSDKTQQSGFYKFIAKNINRSEFAVYRRITRLINEENYIGRWSQDMNEELLRLHKDHGNKWTIISQHLGVSSDLCRDHYRILVKNSHVKGNWSSEEEQCLKEALAKHGVDWSSGDGSIPVGVTWDVIAQEVKTRNSSQCRKKWTMMLAWKVQGGQEQWDPMDDLKLLEILGNDTDVEDEDEVDWAGLVEEWESARTKYFIRQKWSGLKRLVPQYQFKTFQECLDYLLSHYLPALREKCKKK